ncbi:sugar transferase [Catellatospora bangladeshensis]|uniref:Exopolysaccharide biosynthesis polyprenyl glycosylphosphotransferase n=1 Tax=Catellatospora bangladeshensis TaxID=310355 RepID=A0A8J3JLB3_9ACTN|nr:sugar transferase [Catellatospora bangladeshensis]GIF82597.1 exopolysaccharide biosynthesis polyprenyl glycosylphosphotransferase [Catellatospora bangladeshensis]
MEQRRDDDRRGPRPYPQRHRLADDGAALAYTATPTPAGPAPFSPAPVGLVAVRPQTPAHRPAVGRRPLHGGSTHIGTPVRVLDRRKGWEQRYLRTLITSDLLVGAAAGLLVYMLRFGHPVTPYTTTYLLLSLALPFALVASLALTRAYDKRHLYVGTQEYDRVMRAGLWLIASAAVGSYALELPTARSYVLIAPPAATAALVVTRFLIRKSLHRRRERGDCLRRVIVVGHELAIIGLTRQLCRERFHGLEVVGACVPRGSDGRVGLPVYGTFDDVAAAVRAAGADTVIVLSCPELDGHALRRMAWALERDEIDLIVASSLIDVAGGRTTIRPVDGLPMLHVEHPRLSGGSRVVKELMDRIGAALLLVVFAPLLLVTAMALRIDSAGPALFKQVRVGRDGREFVIYKFRTMYVDAEARLAELKHLNEHDGVLFKIRDDPRVTAMGRWMRRYSLDELPQLLNVLLGQMSLVGPRPPLPHEVAAYADDVRRRLAVKPGMTGLWQVSGRSDLPWEEAVRLDLRYVENWSMSMDLLILLRTLTAVARSSGAY